MSYAANVYRPEPFLLQKDHINIQNAPSSPSVNLTTSTKTQRLSYIKGIIVDIARQKSNGVYQKLMPVIHRLHQDADEDIRIAIVSILPSIGEVICENSANARYLVQLLQFSATLLSDHSNYVREAALTSFDSLASFLPPSAQDKTVIPVITDLVGSETKMDRICGLLLLVSLLEKGIPLGGGTHLVNWLTILLSDEDHEVRQELASLYSTFIKVLPEDQIVKIGLPHFKFLVKDRIWSVRKATAEVLPSLLESLPEKRKDLQSMIAGYYGILAADLSSSVRLATQQSLGEMLNQLDTHLITEEMIDSYATSAEESAEFPAGLVMGSCAKYFAAVLAKLGSERWDQLRKLFLALTESLDEEILASLAATTPDLAQLLPTHVFHSDVLPFVVKLMTGGSLSVKTTIVNIFSDLLTLLPEEGQSAILENLDALTCSKRTSVELQNDKEHSYVTFFTKGWRLRASLVNQLFGLSLSVSSRLVCEFLLPHVFHLCEDSVAHVRLESIGQIVGFLNASNPEYDELVLRQLRKWQGSSNFKIRCVAAGICKEAKQQSLNEETMTVIEEIIQTLKIDSVADVRRLL